LSFDFVDIGGIVVDHHCLEVILPFADIGGIIDHYFLNFLFIMHYKLIISASMVYF
jgi:hypothetical protein